VRRVVSKAVADKVRHILLDVVDEGTALKAAIDNYLLAGKTGTPRGTVRGRYIDGRYNPNFVGLFPGDNPQYVIVVKLTAPRSSIYAGQTAAPVTKAILEAALAARNAALDRTQLASSVRPASKPDGAAIQPADVAPQTQASASDSGRRAANTPLVGSRRRKSERSGGFLMCAVWCSATRCVRCTVPVFEFSSPACKGHSPPRRAQERESWRRQVHSFD
jgi:membrane peptidoglycan carboxypeptidase